jgi:hypothetical protein
VRKLVQSAWKPFSGFVLSFQDHPVTWPTLKKAALVTNMLTVRADSASASLITESPKLLN